MTSPRVLRRLGSVTTEEYAPCRWGCPDVAEGVPAHRIPLHNRLGTSDLPGSYLLREAADFVRRDTTFATDEVLAAAERVAAVLGPRLTVNGYTLVTVEELEAIRLVGDWAVDYWRMNYDDPEDEYAYLLYRLCVEERMLSAFGSCWGPPLPR